MPQLPKIFTGKLNLDDNPYRIEEGDFIDALNITRDSEGAGQDVVVSNIGGTVLYNYDFPIGRNKVIGQKEDVVRNRVYFYVWNSNGYHSWLYLNKTTSLITKLIEDLTDTDNIPVLDFNPSKKINHVRIIYRDDEGDMIFWTDGNTTPKKANVQNIEDAVYTVIKSAFIELAKMPPLAPPTGTYGNDTTKTGNALRRKLFQFSHRFEYDDFEKSTFSPYSKIPLPVGIYGSDNDLDNSNNNFITITVETGDENVTDIEVAVRSNIGDAWGDFVLATTLNKEQLLIPDNSEYQYLFYNDALYPPIDVIEAVELFDWCPQLADTLDLANGNTPVLCAITEGYNAIAINDLDVTMTVENVKNSPPDTDPPAVTYEFLGASYEFTVTGSVPTGTRYQIYIFFNGTPPSQTYGVRLVADYTSVGGDTVDDVAFALYSQFNSYSSVPVITGSYSGSNTWQSTFGASGSYPQQIVITPGSSAGEISTEKTWLWAAQYIFGLVYEDEQGRDMPGVITFANPTDSDNDFVVNTPVFAEDSGVPKTPVISASINHLPPAGAKKFHWVRRRQTYGSFLFYMTCDYQDPSDGYLYFCLANIDAFKSENSQFIYGTAPITAESRIKIIAGVTTSAYNGDLWTQDYQILGTVTRTLTGGSSPADDRLFIKVTKPIGSISPSYTTHMVVMIYTPAANPTSLADSVYYEWGESYDIYELDGVYYHRGGDQDQTASQPATFTFEEGDVYYRNRGMYEDIVGDPPYTAQTVNIMDANYSDYFDSAVNDNGRAHAIEVNARRQFNPTLARFAEAYQSGTNINGTNRFYFENFDEYDRSNGIIRRTFIEGKYMYVFQQFDIGVVPVLLQIVRDTAGNPLEANSDILLNKIQYPYNGKFGIGDTPEAFAYGKGAKYFCDPNKGVICRLSQDGITVLSVIYKTNAWFVKYLAAYKTDLNNGIVPDDEVYEGNPTVYFGFDNYTNKLVIALEEINRYDTDKVLTFHQDAYTLSFNETTGSNKGFESFYSYHPEFLGCLDNYFYSFKNGQLWGHTTDLYCEFYGVQYECYITPVFNHNGLQKKTWIGVSETSNIVWDCPEIYSQLNTYGSQRQESTLTTFDFRLLEGEYHASFKRDINSIGGRINGNSLKGNWLVVKFRVQYPSTFVFLNIVSVKFINSPLSPR